MITTLLFRRLQRVCRSLVLACLFLAGCAPSLDPEEYGQVIYKLPQVEGADQPYPLPELEPPASKSGESTK
jgi:hypothetical protein